MGPLSPESKLLASMEALPVLMTVAPLGPARGCVKKEAGRVTIVPVLCAISQKTVKIRLFRSLG